MMMKKTSALPLWGFVYLEFLFFLSFLWWWWVAYANLHGAFFSLLVLFSPLSCPREPRERDEAGLSLSSLQEDWKFLFSSSPSSSWLCLMKILSLIPSRRLRVCLSFCLSVFLPCLPFSSLLTYLSLLSFFFSFLISGFHISFVLCYLFLSFVFLCCFWFFQGISFLDVKNQLLSTYVMYLSYYILLKTHGISVKDHPVIERLVEIRVLLEKIRPIENRLQFQMDRLLQLAASQDSKTTESEDDEGNQASFSLSLSRAFLSFFLLEKERKARGILVFSSSSSIRFHLFSLLRHLFFDSLLPRSSHSLCYLSPSPSASLSTHVPGIQTSSASLPVLCCIDLQISIHLPIPRCRKYACTYRYR